MDRFLKEQETGELVDTQNPFTVEKRLSRKKVLESLPQSRDDAVYRLLEGAVREYGRNAARNLLRLHRDHNQNHVTYLTAELPLSTEQIQDLVEELREPFSRRPGCAKLAKAILRAAALNVKVKIDWSGSLVSELVGSSAIQLEKGRLDIPDSLPDIRRAGLSLTLRSIEDLTSFHDYEKALARWPYRYCEREEPILPLESRSRGTMGFFDYRCKPFTAIRTFATAPHGKTPLKLDFWKGPYLELDSQNLILEKKKPGKFLFLRWKPSYGRPTFLYRWSGSERAYGPQECGATFWIDSSDTPAQVQFYSDSVVSDFVSVEGPAGLTGLICWPGLRYDLWGTALVKDSAYEEALAWTQEEVRQTADCLSRNLDQVVERLRCSNLFKGSYADETIARIEALWA